jgi:hypothetical protein
VGFLKNLWGGGVCWGGGGGGGGGGHKQGLACDRWARVCRWGGVLVHKH